MLKKNRFTLDQAFNDEFLWRQVTIHFFKLQEMKTFRRLRSINLKKKKKKINYSHVLKLGLKKKLVVLYNFCIL